jgi:Protein of unknown function (DUF1488)
MLTIDPLDLAAAVERDTSTVKADMASAMMWFARLSQDNKATNMAINFPNPIRSYDATRQAVRFWGYDRSMESSFFVTIDALKQMQPNLRADAVDFLRAFDSNSDRIYAIAAKVYARGHRGFCELNVADI